MNTTSPRRIEITVDQDGFSPDQIRVEAGEPVTLAFTRRVERTCAKRVVIQLGEGQIEKALPLDQTVTLDLTFATSGQLAYACPMGHITGEISVQ